MHLTAAEREKLDNWTSIYRESQLPAVLEVERAVCGCDYGGTSWTTRAEADDVAEALALAPGIRLLEIGAGTGWPGLYLSGQSGCRVTLVDLPAEALEIAGARADSDGIAARVETVVANAAVLPFADASFDAVSHSDVLCCLLPKHEALTECRRVLRPGGRMVFSVIYLAGDLSPQDHARAAETAPGFAETEAPYPQLLAETGWELLETRDLTDDFRRNCLAKIEAEQQARAELVALTADGEIDARQARFHRRAEALERGHVKRELFVAAPS